MFHSFGCVHLHGLFFSGKQILSKKRVIILNAVEVECANRWRDWAIPSVKSAVDTRFCTILQHHLPQIHKDDSIRRCEHSNVHNTTTSRGCDFSIKLNMCLLTRVAYKIGHHKLSRLSSDRTLTLHHE